MKKYILTTALILVLKISFSQTNVSTYFAGTNAGNSTVSGNYSTAVGVSAGDFVTGANNSFFGYLSGGVTTLSGANNSYFGYQSGKATTTGNNNVYFGYNAGLSTTIGNTNVFIGSSAGNNNVSGTGNVFLGNSAGFSELGSNKLYIDNSNVTTPLIYGDFSTNQVGINSLVTTGNALSVGGSIFGTDNLIFGTTLNTGTLHLNHATNNFSLKLNATNRINVLNASGFVGIGANLTPTEMLHVGGNILSTGNMTATGNIASTTGLYSVNSTTSNYTLRLNATDRLTVLNTTGDVGIGTAAPGSRLEVFGSTLNRVSALVNADVKNGFQIKRTGTNATDWEIYNPASSLDLKFSNAGLGDLLTIKSDGNVGIGTPMTSNTNGYKLAVKGKIGAWDLQIEKISNAWSDFVFESNYKLLPLNEVERYIKQNGHLNGVPSAAEVEKDGYTVSGMDATLLKKIEELTLYVIQQQKEIEAMKKELANKK